jgi:hypothetical protein
MNAHYKPIVAELRGALRELSEACYLAHTKEELSEVDGSLLDRAKQALANTEQEG